MHIHTNADGSWTCTAADGETLHVSHADEATMMAAVGALKAEHPDAAADRVLVPKYLIVDRLQAAGKLNAARAALDACDLYTRERWNTRDAIYADDAATLTLLTAIGADSADILAPV